MDWNGMDLGMEWIWNGGMDWGSGMVVDWGSGMVVEWNGVVEWTGMEWIWM